MQATLREMMYFPTIIKRLCRLINSQNIYLVFLPHPFGPSKPKTFQQLINRSIFWHINLNIGGKIKSNIGNKLIRIRFLLEVLKGHIFQQGWMPQNKTSPLFLVDLPIMFCISFLEGLKHYPKTKQIFFHVILAEANNEQM